MSKSKLKPEDIFFGLQKTMASDDETAEQAPVEKGTPVAMPPDREDGACTSEDLDDDVDLDAGKAVQKKRGPAPNPENARRVPVNVHVAPETKYTMKSLINEMKLRGCVGRYSMTDFVAEAIEEKIQREKERFGIE